MKKTTKPAASKKSTQTTKALAKKSDSLPIELSSKSIDRLKKAGEAAKQVGKKHPLAVAGALIGAGVAAGIAADRAMRKKTPSLSETVLTVIKGGAARGIKRLGRNK